jgi:hypothetical protein
MPKKSSSQRERDPQLYYWPVGDMVGGSLFIIVSLLFIYGALYMPWRSSPMFLTYAGFTPIFLSAIVLTLSAILVVLVLKEYGYRSRIGWAQTCLKDEIVQRWLMLVLITGIYVFLVGRVPFVLANAVFYLFIFRYQRVGNWPQIIGYTVLSVVFICILVPWLFAMPVP